MGTHRLVVDYIVFEFEGHHIFLASLSGGWRNECCNLKIDHLMSLVFTNSFSSKCTHWTFKFSKLGWISLAVFEVFELEQPCTVPYVMLLMYKCSMCFE